MEPSLSKKRLADYMRNLSQLVKDVADQKVSQEEAADRLRVLKAEHLRLEQSGMFPLNMKVPFEQEKEKDMQKLKKVSPPAPTPANHELDFKCQCKSCVSKHTITMDDFKFLKGLRILWNTPAQARDADGK